MSELSIDRLTLKLAGVSEADGRRLATLVAERLAATDLPASTAARVASIRLDLRADPRTPIEALTEQVVEGVVRELLRVG